MSGNPVKIAIIGCGRVAGHHCRSIAETDGAELIAVCDLNAELAENYAKQYDCASFTNYHRMLSDTADVDVVSIITPSGMHFEHLKDVVENHSKNVIVEKPTFLRPENAEEALSLAQAHGVTVFPVFQNRYNKAVQRVKKALQLGELGDIRIVSVRVRWCRPQRYYDLSPWRGTFSHDGGVLTNQSIHHIDLLRYLGGEVSRVSAQLSTVGVDIEAEDTAIGMFEFENDAVGTLEATTAARPDDFEASLSVVGSKGLAQIGGIAVNELQIFTPSPDDCAPNSEDFIGIEGHGAVYGFGHSELYRNVVDHLNGRNPCDVDLTEAMATLKLLHAFYRSDEAGDWVNVRASDSSDRLGRANDEISDLYRTKPE